MTQPNESDRLLISATIELQRDNARAIRLAVNVLRGPDPGLRSEAIASLGKLASVMEESTARLEELRG